MKVYRVKNWSKHYENNRTRELKKMQWVPVPNSHDGDGYTALVCREDGPELFGAWVVILQVASKCGEVAPSCGGRGTLLRDGCKPHDFESIARITRFPQSVIKKALSVLSSQDVGWLELVEVKGVADVKQEIPQEGAAIPQAPAAIPQAPAAIPQAPAAIPQEGDYGMERKERNGKKENTPTALDFVFPNSLNTDRFKATWTKWLDYRNKMAGKKPKNPSATFNEQLKWLAQFGEAKSIATIEKSIRMGWTGLFEPDNASQGTLGIPTADLTDAEKLAQAMR